MKTKYKGIFKKARGPKADPGFLILDAGFLMLDTGYWMLDVGAGYLR